MTGCMERHETACCTACTVPPGGWLSQVVQLSVQEGLVMHLVAGLVVGDGVAIDSRR